MQARLERLEVEVLALRLEVQERRALPIFPATTATSWCIKPAGLRASKSTGQSRAFAVACSG